jgi:hypothetical protein
MVVSVIKDDGTVVDITCSSSTFTISGEVSFYNDGLYLTLGNSNGSLIWNYGFWTIPQSDNVITVNTKTGSTQDADAFYRWDISGTYSDMRFAGDYPTTQMRANFGANFGSTYALQLVEENKADIQSSLGAQITSSYNTGWMNGDIKLATLSDTDDTDVTGSELVTNGTFDTNWLATGSGSPTMTAVSGQLFLETSLNGDRMTYPVATVAGKTYVFDFESTSQADDHGVTIGTTQGGEEIYAASDIAVGHHTYTFVAQGSTTYVGFKEFVGTAHPNHW